MRGARPAATSAGRSKWGKIAGAKSRAAGFARRQYNRLRAINNRRAKVLPDQTGNMEGDGVFHSWMHSKLDSRGHGKLNKVAYVRVKDMIERKLAHQKRGMPNECEYREMAKELEEDRNEKALDSVTIENEIRRFAERIEKYNTEPVGSMTETRQDGTFRIMFCQLNGAATKAIRDQKIRGMNYLAKKYDVGVRMFNEHGCNMDNAQKGQNFANWIQIGEENRCIVSYNKNDACSKTLYQPGGTGMYVSGEMVQYVKKMKSDPCNLGRWSSCLFWSNPNHKCRLVTAYNLPDSKPKGLMTNYQQLKRHCQRNNIDLEPRSLFYRDFAKQCKKWKSRGETIGIVMDANEHALDGELRKILEGEGIGLMEISHRFWGEKPPNSHVDGSDPIAAFYGSSNLEVTQLLQLPHLSSIGDHKTWIIEVTSRSVLGCNLLKIQRTVGRRLNMSNHGTVTEFIKLVKEGCEEQNIQSRLEECLSQASKLGTPTPKWLKKKIRLVHNDFDRIRLHAERNCRKIYTPESPYSRPIQVWYDRIHAYIALFKVLENPSNRNVGNTFRFAKRQGIENPESMTLAEIEEGMTYCKIMQREAREKAHPMREDHLLDRLRIAIKKKKTKVIAHIKQIINGERSRKNWRHIKYVLCKPRTPPVTTINRMEDGCKVKYDTEEDIKMVFREECRERFTSARSAPIMDTYLGRLGTIDENNVLDLEALADGRLEIPDELDMASKLMLEEIANMKDLTLENDKIPVVTATEFMQFWNGVSEHTQSSPSGLHYGVYKASAKDESLSDIHAKQMTLIARSGVYPSRWSKSMQILRQKRAGEEVDMSNLRYLQLFEGDFNWLKQIFIGRIAMENLTNSGLLPEEHGSRRGSTAIDASLDVALSVDVSRQARIPMAILSLDASQCFDRVNHIFMALIWIVLTRNLFVVFTILACLQTMEFFQRTGYGDSQDCFGIINCITTWMGLGQGSRGASHGWMQLSTVIVNVMKKTGHASDMINPISGEKVNSLGSLFVDDANLMVYGDRKKFKTTGDLYRKVRATAKAWAYLLRATGGSLKPVKCFWWLIGYVCNKRGEWEYEDTKGTTMPVLGEDREMIEVPSLATNEERKSLGVFFGPEGGSKEQLESIKEKVKEWTDKMRNGHLPPNLAWLAYTHKLWPSASFGLGTMTNDVEATDTLLDDEDYASLNAFGVASTLKKDGGNCTLHLEG